MRHALILAGGSGQRLWPFSRESRPKQLIPFLDGRCLLSAAAERLGDIVVAENLYVCALERYRESICAALPGWDAGNFIGEPEARDTLMAIGLSASLIARRDPEAVMAVFPADHVIAPAEEFRIAVRLAYTVAEQVPDVLITFGIAPTAPSTAYGHIEIGPEFGGPGVRRVLRFHEKPDRDGAEEYFRAGSEQYLWNSGIFVWRAKTMLESIRRYRPETAAALVRIARDWDTPERDSTLQVAYSKADKISIDYAVMEPASNGQEVTILALPFAADWLDVGSWPAFGLTRGRDEAGNAIAADCCLLQDSSRNLVVSDDSGHLVALLGCEDLIVVHSSDATMVCRADHAERLKQLHAAVSARFGGRFI